MLNDTEIAFATLSDVSSWMQLVELVRWNFPGLETKELIDGYKDTVIKNINRNSAICAKKCDNVIGVLLFSVKHNMLCCMAIHPEYRKKGIATRMIHLFLEQLPTDCDVVVSTFREEDEKGIAPRALYKKIGFVEDELCCEFNHQGQKFIFHRK